MGRSVNVNSSNFDREVLKPSLEKPVLVDFFAQWCGPCTMLKPILERLVEEYDFILAKVDIDQNPDLAQVYHVEGVPDVRVVTQGDVQPGFVGVLPEPKLRNLLSGLGLKSSLEARLETVHNAISTGDIDHAKAIVDQLLVEYPDHRPFQMSAARFLMSINDLDGAERVLTSIQDDDRQYFKASQALRGLIQIKRYSLDLTIENDLDESFAKAAHATVEGDYETALQLFLEVVSRDRTYRDDAARKAMLTVFEVLGDDHPVTRHYRKQLMLSLY
jgi:putative thioredoxin